MKQTGKLMRRITLLFFVFPCLFLCPSCGLESFYFLDAPETDGHNSPSYESEDEMQLYFSFLTKEQSENNSQYIGSGAEFSFKGTEVYYKIYNNVNDMKSVENSIDSLNTSSTASVSDAADKLLGTYGYQPLSFWTTGDYVETDTPFIKADGNDRYVYIRLNDIRTDYPRGVCVGSQSFESYDPDSAITRNSIPVKPVRKMDKPYGFNFTGTGDSTDEDYSPLPVKDDPDFNFNETATADGKWYVDMYAFSSGTDTTLTKSYSRVLFLGSITISESDYDK